MDRTTRQRTEPGSAADEERRPGEGSAASTTRDPFIDFVRGFSLLVVVAWHWCFTIILWRDDGPHATNPIRFTDGLVRLFSNAVAPLQHARGAGLAALYADLREGVHTLPVLFALSETGPGADRLRELLKGPIEDDDLLAEALTLLRASSGIAKAKATVQKYAEQAGEELAGLPDVPGRRALASLVDYTINRHG